MVRSQLLQRPIQSPFQPISNGRALSDDVPRLYLRRLAESKMRLQCTHKRDADSDLYVRESGRAQLPSTPREGPS